MGRNAISKWIEWVSNHFLVDEQITAAHNFYDQTLSFFKYSSNQEKLQLKDSQFKENAYNVTVSITELVVKSFVCVCEPEAGGGSKIWIGSQTTAMKKVYSNYYIKT